MAQYTNRDTVYYVTRDELEECDIQLDFNGVMLAWIEEAKDFLPIESFCDNCGSIEDDCECLEPDIIPVETFIKIIKTSNYLD